MNRYQVVHPRLLTKEQFDLARGTSLMEAFIRNMVSLHVLRRYGTSPDQEYLAYPQSLDHAVTDFLASNMSGPYYIETIGPGHKITIYFSESADTVAFKLKFHGVETKF